MPLEGMTNNLLPDLADPIKRLGTYRITIGIAHDVKATITVKVLAEAGE